MIEGIYELACIPCAAVARLRWWSEGEGGTGVFTKAASVYDRAVYDAITDSQT